MANPEINNEQYGIRLDIATGELDIFLISEKPENHQFGLFISHRTGTKDQMLQLKERIVLNAFRILKKVK